MSNQFNRDSIFIILNPICYRQKKKKQLVSYAYSLKYKVKLKFLILQNICGCITVEEGFVVRNFMCIFSK